jgi:hypothetical protein
MSDERFWAGAVIGEVAIDRGDEGTEHAGLQAAPGELGEEAFDRVELGCCDNGVTFWTTTCISYRAGTSDDDGESCRCPKIKIFCRSL